MRKIRILHDGLEGTDATKFIHTFERLPLPLRVETRGFISDAFALIAVEPELDLLVIRLLGPLKLLLDCFF